ncbi:TetR/AcrR family transcriptional regulator [Sphingobium sp. AN558]|uniref:TetR/AcrR family transcriptional regulator n=1 Tax=Sphingobium sp. AN558 TaxID=3133442 RepID=UPI0030BABE20
MTYIAPSSLSRREARRIDRREAILTVAERSFMEHGYAGTTMSAIAASLGGSKGTLWNHFPSKEELFAAVLERATTDYRLRLSQILDPGEQAIDTLRHFCVSFLEKITSPESIALYRLVASEAGRFPEIGHIFYQHAPRHTRHLLAAYIAGATERGQLRACDPELAARALTTLVMSGCHQQLLWGLIDTAPADLIAGDAEFATDLFMRAYAP